jgi:hypothetical protein
MKLPHHPIDDIPELVLAWIVVAIMASILLAWVVFWAPWS